MIQKMRKYSFLIFHREYEEFLATLQGLGVVHVSQRINPTESEQLRALIEQRQEIASKVKALGQWLPDGFAPVEAPASDKSETELLGIIESYQRTLDYYQELGQELSANRQEISDSSIWGLRGKWHEPGEDNYLHQLQKQGYKLSFYTTSAGVFKTEYQERYQAIEIARRGVQVYFAVLSSPYGGQERPSDAEAVTLPEYSLDELEAISTSLQETIAAQERQLKEMAPQVHTAFMSYDKLLASRYTLGAARLQALPTAEDKLLFLVGWVPNDKASAMEASLGQTGYYVQESEIEDTDAVPIQLRNSFFGRLFEPITGMFSLPNYGEIDQTVLFAPFFMLFFGMCLGDGGYGLILLLLSTIAKMRMKAGQNKDLPTLLQWLGGTAAIVGFAMGSVFGVTMGYAQVDGYLFGQDNMMMISILLGLLQILFAKLVAAYKTKVQRGLKYALAPFAWVVLILALAAYIAISQEVIVLPAWVDYVVYSIIGVSALVAFLYNTPGKNPLLNIGSGLWNTYNVASGLLGDTLSYIRLFAIGLTGGILGWVFNSLAIEQTASLPIYIRVPLMLVILLLGHGLNLGLAMISSFVHPLRLTFVEYYKNSEFEGGGKPYTPLEK